MSANKKDESEKPIAVITYDYEKEPPMFYATGARIMALGPIYLKLNFFVDNLQDHIAEESIYQKEGKQRTGVTAVRFTGPQRIRREFKASIMIPLSTADGLVTALTEVVKKREEEK